MEFIDHIIYINLDSRPDRRAEIEAEFARLQIPADKITRFSAITHANPGVGCNLSHAAVLRQAHAMNHNNVLVLEDDFNFCEDPRRVQEGLIHFFTTISDWNAVQLTAGVYDSEPYDDLLNVAKRTSNAAGYLVNAHLMLPLAETIENATEPLEQTGAHWLYVNDVVWCKFMEDRRWFYFKERLGYQRPSFSNLSGRFVDYR